MPTNLPAPFRKYRSTILLSIGLLVFLLGTVFLTNKLKDPRSIKASLGEAQLEVGAFPIVVPEIKYGFALDTFQVKQDTVRSGDYLGTILARQGLSYPDIERLVANSDTVFKVNQLRVNKPYLILSRDEAQGPDYFIYEPSVYEYIVFDLKDLSAKKARRKVDKKPASIAGVIESSLWAAMAENDASPELFSKMEDALQWSVDFYRVQKGDQFKLVYEEEYIDGKRVGAGLVHAAVYKTENRTHHAIYFDSNDEQEGYYDLEGRPLNKGFLKSPVKSSRISSRYNLRRFHPILKRVKPHLGTDYAAPYGTPILAVGSGTVVRAGYTKGNGNFVKIKHDDTYQTQYLHMQKFASGIKVGAFVTQGQVIGYVGSTGLATGPHVCFRFWKKGRQVNHLNLSFPPPEPLSEDVLPTFFARRDQLMTELDKLVMPELPGEEQQPQEEITATPPHPNETASQPAAPPQVVTSGMSGGEK